MLARLVPGIIPPTIGTATLVEVEPAAFANPYNYSYRVDVAVTINGPAPPTSFGWRAYVSTGPTNTSFPSTASNATLALPVGVNNLSIELTSGALASNYIRVEVGTTDSSGNFTVIWGTSNILQMPSRKKLYGITYADTQSSFTHPSGVSSFDIFFTSKGGRGSGEIPGAQMWGGGGAGVRINNLPIDSETYHIDNRTNQSSCYIRRSTAGNTSDQIFANNGSDATVSPYNDGTGASSATLSGFFTGGTLVANGGGQTGGNSSSPGTTLGGRSGIHSSNNPPYPGQNVSSSSGLTGLVDNDDDGNPDFAIFNASAYGCGGYGVFFPDGNPTFGSGQVGSVYILYYE